MLKKIPPLHPGEFLLEEFLKPYKMSQYRLAKDISVSPRRINEIIHGKRSLTPDTALRLGKYFGVSAEFWLNLQAHYDLEVQKDILEERLNKEVKIAKNKRLLKNFKNIQFLGGKVRKNVDVVISSVN